MSEGDAAALATEYTLALLKAGKIPAINAEQTKDAVAAIASAHQQFMGDFIKLPGGAPADPPKKED